MNKFLRIVVALLLSFNTLEAQKLSENSQVSLLTISPGEELWSFAGHSAIRIKDPVNGIDANFNYGVFNFRTEGFYLKFLLGTLPYSLGAYNFKDEFPLWAGEGRQITEQDLNLTLVQKQEVFDFLVDNYQPNNREYLYKFFYDNCSTRIRDVFELACTDSLQFNQNLQADSTFREWLHVYNRKSKNDWVEFGMDILLGTYADEKTNASRAMYIPDNLMIAFDSAKVYRNNQWENLVLNKGILNEQTLTHKALFISPFYLFSILFLLLCYITFVEFNKKKWFLIVDKLFFTLTGLIGWFMFVLWFFTDHGVMNNNGNLMWALPIVFPAIWFLNRKKGTQKWLKYLFILQVFLSLFILISFSFSVQKYHIAIIPITGMVLLRSFFVWQRKNNKELL